MAPLSSTGISLLVLLLIAYMSTVLGVIGTVLSENRNPLKASAWVLIVGFVPVVGLVAYILFGQDQRRLHRISRRIYRLMMRHPIQLALPDSPLQHTGAMEHWRQLIAQVEQGAHAPLLAVGDIEVFTEGEAMYERLLQDIAGANHHIHIEAYVFEEGEWLDRLTSALIRKRSQGVDVRLIYDYLGSYSVDKAYWQRLQSMGLQVYPFLPVKLPLLSSTVNYRNHRKLIIIDGAVGYVGGMNFADKYARGNELGLWRDTHFRLTGDAVSSLQGTFLLDWYVVSRRVITAEPFFPKPLAPRGAEGSSRQALQFVLGGPIDDQPNIEQAFVRLIYSARASIKIQTPYFLPTETLHRALISAALSGVEVEIMLPERGDSRVTSYAVASYITSLLEVGIKVYWYTSGFLHSKLMLVDATVSAIGSANLDFRSLEHNFEIAGLLYHESLTKELEEVFERDKTKCRLIDLDEWQRRGRMQRLGESVMRLFSPLL